MCGVWRGYDVTGVGGGEFALQLVSRQRVAPLYWRSDTHTHTHRTDPQTHRLEHFLKFPELSGQVGISRIPSKNADRKITNLSGKHSFTLLFS
jgi:hypothetical protein